MSGGPLVAPFQGERYAGGVPLTDVVAPPYDVIDDAARGALARRHEANVVHLILPEGGDQRYAHAASLLGAWRHDGWVASDPAPGLYVVRQRFRAPGGVTLARTGVIAAVLAEPFGEGRVKPHERTHAGPKQDRLALLRATQTMFEALLLLSRDGSGALRRALADATAAAPVGNAQLDGVEIALWRVEGKAATALAAAAGTEPLYIADGHHRYETAVAYSRENPGATRTLGLIVPIGDPGLVVLPTHRLIPRAVGSDVSALLADAAVVERLPDHPKDPQLALDALAGRGGGCLVVTPDGWHRVTRARTADPALGQAPQVVASLDVAWTDAVVVPRLRPLGDTSGLRYTPDPDVAVAAVLEEEAGAAVLLNPPAVEQVLAVADAGAFMPPKATFFTPKVPSGLAFLSYGPPTT